MLPEVANAQATSEREVEIKTPDGTCDAYFVHPSSGGAAAGVLIWPDIFGLRPAMRTMGKRLAGSGYSVLVVNPFYRAGKPTATGATPIKEMMQYRKGMSPETDVMGLLAPMPPWLVSGLFAASLLLMGGHWRRKRRAGFSIPDAL